MKTRGRYDLSLLLLNAAMLLLPSVLHASLKYTGVNLAGAEFGTSLPGTYGTDYIYPNAALRRLITTAAKE